MNDILQIEYLKSELENVIRENYNKLYSYVFRITGNHQDSEDILQNAFLNAYKNLSKFKNQSKLYTWLFRIVINESYKYFEYIKKLPLTRITEKLGVSEQEFFSQIEYTPKFEDNLVIDEMREKCLQAFLKCLPKNQRVCFLLKTCLNFKNKEIAEILDMTVENVKVTIFRGRKRLQELFNMRCSLIDPEKPCKCHLWIKYMNDRNLPLPEGYKQPKAEQLKKEHFNNLSLLNKINYLYAVEQQRDKEMVLEKIKQIVAEIV